MLTGGVGLLPLAPLADVQAERLGAVVRRMEDRLAAEGRPEQSADLWAATFLLMGLRYTEALAAQVIQGVQTMKESVTYLAILREGGAQALKKMLLLQGRIRFGQPDGNVRAAFDAISDRELPYLEKLSERLLEVSNWEELLATPRPKRRKKRGES